MRIFITSPDTYINNQRTCCPSEVTFFERGPGNRDITP
jgi:hypothetical protein